MRVLVAILCLIAAPLWAVEPDEILDDPALEARARELSKELRCLVCRNESIDESHAALARDLRILLRERLVAGDSDDEAMEFLVARYGEFVLLKPTLTGSNLVLWLAGPAMLILGMGLGLGFVRRRSQPAEATLSAEEEARIKDLLGK